ncbi:MAG: hypothetical protein HHJ12_07150 [Glaciimonas sp.]|nr:hypothetical protein [Glaciimonas sp.]
MDSEKPNFAYQLMLPDLAKSGEAAFSLQKLKVFQDQNSSTSVTAGVFSGYNRSIVA